MNKLSIYQRLLLGFGLLLIQLLAIAGLAMYSMADTSQRLGTITDDIAPKVEAANEMSQAVGQALSAVGNMGIVTAPADVEREYSAVERIVQKLRETRASFLAASASAVAFFFPADSTRSELQTLASGFYKEVQQKIGASGTAQDAAIMIRMEVGPIRRAGPKPKRSGKRTCGSCSKSWQS